MIKDKTDIEEKLQQLQIDIDENYSQTQFTAILNLAKEMVIYLKTENLLTFWAKMNIVKATNALHSNCFKLSLQYLSLALSDKNKVSTEIKYNDEIIKLSADEIINRINDLKGS